MFPPIGNMFPLFWNTVQPSIPPISCTGKSSRIFILPTKITSTFFQVKQVDVILAGKDIASVFSEILPDASVQTMPLCFG
jgi:hypothetical protein